jgi:hypothetical protein
VGTTPPISVKHQSHPILLFFSSFASASTTQMVVEGEHAIFASRLHAILPFISRSHIFFSVVMLMSIEQASIRQNTLCTMVDQQERKKKKKKVNQ